MKSGLGQLEPQNGHCLIKIYWKSMKSGPGQLEPQSGLSLTRIWLKLNEIWDWPAGAPKWTFFNDNLIENQWDLGLLETSWGTWGHSGASGSLFRRENNVKIQGSGFIHSKITVKTQGSGFLGAIMTVKTQGSASGRCQNPVFLHVFLLPRWGLDGVLIFVTRKHRKTQGSGNTPMQNPVFLRSYWLGENQNPVFLQLFHAIWWQFDLK